MIKVRGNSGCGVELINESVVRKSTIASGAARLERQIRKQEDFSRRINQGRIRAPEILQSLKSVDGLAVDMKFISGKDFIQFLTEAGRETLDDFGETMASHILENLKDCQMLDVEQNIRQKLDELTRNGVPERYVNVARTKCEGGVEVPVGPCHGDLTLSNILFKDRLFYFIDFLDSYVETPLQDIIKLRQDTRFGWSLQLYKAEFDRVKMQIALAYLDRKIDEMFRRFDWHKNHADLFELMNWMRIFPYCTEEKTTQFVTATLDFLLNHQTKR